MASVRYVVLTIGIMIVSTAAILFKLAEQAGAPALAIAAGRLTLAALILTPLAWARAGTELRTLGWRERGLALLAGVFLALHFAAWFASLVYTSVASSTTLVTTTPVWVSLAGWLLWRERVAKATLLGLALAVVGSVLIALSDQRQALGGANQLLGDALALGGGMAVAGYFLAGRALRSRVTLLAYISMTYGAAALVLLAWSSLAGQSLLGYSPLAYGLMLALAVGPQLLGHTALNWSLGYLSATFVTVAVLAEPIGSTILALLILGQVPQPLQIVGGCVLLGGIMVASLGERRPQSAAEPAEPVVPL